MRYLFYLACACWPVTSLSLEQEFCMYWQVPLWPLASQGQLIPVCPSLLLREPVRLCSPTSEENPGLSSPWFFKSLYCYNRHSFSCGLAKDRLVLFYLFTKLTLSLAFCFSRSLLLLRESCALLEVAYYYHFTSNKIPWGRSRPLFHLIITGNKVIHS